MMAQKTLEGEVRCSDQLTNSSAVTYKLLDEEETQATEQDPGP